MWQAIRKLWREPRPEGPRSPSRVDAWLALALVPVAVLEAALRGGVAAHAAGLVFAALVAVGLWQRRARPLVATALAFGPAIAFALVALVAPGTPPPAELSSPALALLVPYTLARWGTGRELGAGLALLTASYLGALSQCEFEGPPDAIAGSLVLLFPVAVGAAVRFRAEAERRALERVRLDERALLARDLHDTVAHHVSAIAVQVQAGRAVFATRPEAARDALAVVEDEAKRTLAELRALVRSLRDTPGAELAPQLGLAALAELADGRGAAPTVSVALAPDLGEPGAAVEGALYRIAQEAVTNARRHARGASVVTIRVTREDGFVRLVVEDDGAPVRGRAGAGFGLVGMGERAALLGGTLDAGPGDARGFVVVAELPVRGSGS